MSGFALAALAIVSQPTMAPAPATKVAVFRNVLRVFMIFHPTPQWTKLGFRVLVPSLLNFGQAYRTMRPSFTN
jgi:hypothetical protein